jgi:hypothetical protein
MGQEQPSFKESLENSLVEIAESPTLRLGLSLMLPKPLDEWVAGRGEVIARNRLEDFLQRLLQHWESLEKEAVRSEYFETEEWYDLFYRALEEALKTRSEDKRDLIARILAAASTDFEQSEYSPEEYLNLVATLTVKELEVARTIYKLQKGRDQSELETEEQWQTWVTHRDNIVGEHGVDPDDLPFILDRIASTGLIQLVYVLFPGSPGRTYWVAPAFEKLMRFLELDA